MKRLVLPFLVLTIGLTFFSCKTRTTNSALKKGEVLKSNLNSFEKNRMKLSNNLVESLEEAKESLTAENPNIPEVSKDFEKEWRGIMNRYDKLKKDFDRVGESSQAYFGQLNELSGSINSEELRTSELAKNKELEARWSKTYKKAGDSIEKITQVLESGNDFHMVLVASSIRQKLEQNVAELNNMAEQAKVLLSDLAVFTEAGRNLVEGEG